MAATLNRISIEGFKSIQDLKGFYLRPLNILIGANGAGKSNFVDFFRMLRAMAEERLANFVRETGGGADGFFFGGPRITREIKSHLIFGNNEYRFTLAPAANNAMTVKSEETNQTAGATDWTSHGGGRPESLLSSWKGHQSSWGPYLSAEGDTEDAISSWTVYHFHDTSVTSRMRREHSVRDFRELASDAGNIAAFLYRMQSSGVHRPDSLDSPRVPFQITGAEANYERIRKTVQLIAPFFDDFLLEPENKGGSEVIRLEWKQKGSSFPFQAWQLSDGTIRFICLATALLQPNPPSMIVIDEPELGLHPFALELLAALIKEASMKTQIIISTQSPALLSAFEPEDVIVVDRVDGASRFQRLESEPLKDWLEDFTLGELLQKNVIEAGPEELSETVNS